MRKTYVWTLDVEYPEEPILNDWDEAFSGPFKWPRNRKFLSEKSAYYRAYLFEHHGAKVTVIRSEPVVFPPVEKVRQEITDAIIKGLQTIEQDLR